MSSDSYTLKSVSKVKDNSDEKKVFKNNDTDNIQDVSQNFIEIYNDDEIAYQVSSDEDESVEDNNSKLELLSEKNSELISENSKLKMKNSVLKSTIDELQNNKISKLKIENQKAIDKLVLLSTENNCLSERIDELKNNKDTCFCKNKKCICVKKEKTSTESLVSDSDNLLSTSPSNGPIDPFKILLQLILIFEEIKKDLKKIKLKMNDYQYELNSDGHENDDLIFYRSILLDSKDYFLSSHKIREKKVLFDLNQIVKMFNYKCMPTIYELDKKTVKILKCYYNKLAKEVKQNHKNQSNPIWIKNDKYKYIENIKREMIRVFTYHRDINEYFRNCLAVEIKFYST